MPVVEDAFAGSSAEVAPARGLGGGAPQGSLDDLLNNYTGPRGPRPGGLDASVYLSPELAEILPGAKGLMVAADGRVKPVYSSTVRWSVLRQGVSDAVLRLLEPLLKRHYGLRGSTWAERLRVPAAMVEAVLDPRIPSDFPPRPEERDERDKWLAELLFRLLMDAELKDLECIQNSREKCGTSVLESAHRDKRDGRIRETASRLLCGSWGCASCSTRKAGGLRRRAAKGFLTARRHGIPLVFLTLTFDPRTFLDQGYRPEHVGVATWRAKGAAQAAFLRRLRQLIGPFPYFSMAEAQQSGNAHLHIAVLSRKLVGLMASEAGRTPGELAREASARQAAYRDEEADACPCEFPQLLSDLKQMAVDASFGVQFTAFPIPDDEAERVVGYIGKGPLRTVLGEAGDAEPPGLGAFVGEMTKTRQRRLPVIPRNARCMSVGGGFKLLEQGALPAYLLGSVESGGVRGEVPRQRDAVDPGDESGSEWEYIGSAIHCGRSMEHVLLDVVPAAGGVPVEPLVGPDFRPGLRRDEQGKRPRQVRSVRLTGVGALGLFPERRDTVHARVSAASVRDARPTYAGCPRALDDELLVALGKGGYLWRESRWDGRAFLGAVRRRWSGELDIPVRSPRRAPSPTLADVSEPRALQVGGFDQPRRSVDPFRYTPDLAKHPNLDCRRRAYWVPRAPAEQRALFPEGGD
jgi:hypothetical protein